MKILVVKLTSMGDAIHLLPALSDLQTRYPDAKVDWMIEGGFAEIPTWHSSVDRVIPAHTRRWRKLNWESAKQFCRFIKNLRGESYDIVIDAQGLIKSALFARFAKTNNGSQRIGFSGASIKESPAAWFYTKKIDVERGQHAILRLRQLFAGGFDYPFDSGHLDYQVTPHQPQQCNPQIALLHGTTWASKHLPESHWHELAQLITNDGYQVILPWGNDAEKARAERIASPHKQASVLKKCSLTELQDILRQAKGAIAVDTGLGHLAAAVGLPTISVYGSTNAQLTGAVGENQIHMQSDYACSPCLLKECDKLESNKPPCYQQPSAKTIWMSLKQALNSGDHG